VRAVLCDADGNLFASEEPAFAASTEVLNAFLDGAGGRLDPGAMRRAATGRSFRAVLAEVAASHGVALAADDVERWVERERDLVTARLGAVLRPDPSVAGQLDRLARRYTLATVSSSALSRLSACLDATGLAGRFPAPVRFSAEDSLPEPAGKPDPAVYAYACRRLAVTPQQAVAVEDSVPGVASAAGAGVPVVGNLQFVPAAERPGRGLDLRAAGAAAVAAGWEEVADLLVEPAGPPESGRG
jgi:beta-phosphoglucomutase-like phosphatase (HAD superfamily)